jgi:hypothetical protein
MGGRVPVSFRGGRQQRGRPVPRDSRAAILRGVGMRFVHNRATDAALQAITPSKVPGRAEMRTAFVISLARSGDEVKAPTDIPTTAPA